MDFPGFNLKLLEVKLRKRKIKTVYFIAPQVWAWGRGRIPKIAKYTDILISIWPFGKELYSDYLDQLRFEFVGHPLLDIVRTTKTEKEIKAIFNIPEDKKLFGFLPGSRESEVKTLLPLMLRAGKILQREIPELHFLIPATPNVEKLVKEVLSGHSLPVSVLTEKQIKNPSYEVMKHSVFSVIASGTATLEASIVGNPFLLIYKVSPITFFIGKMLVSIDYLGLPNIIAGKEVVKELLQEECNPEQIASESLKYLKNPQLYEKTKKELQEVKSALGEKGALKKTAQIIKDYLESVPGK
ncbi:MAG: lipid-A-disaccharide synthase [Persephonella sp.]|nr:lipid-A-disaccharide synthase [Persephonella sp.]